MARARLAFQLGYGTPTITNGMVSFYLAGLFNERNLSYRRWTAIIIGISFYLQATVTLLLGAPLFD
ncbi:MAG: hypothetical protein RQ853_07260 [Acidianus sp.]|jgi:nitric oxide reductase subunit B|nr:hypothetical protein [Acidianus sp.]